MTVDEVEQIHSYSTTEEIRCGTWINSKPIYKKTFTGTSTTGTYTVSIKSCSVDMLIKYEIIMKLATGGDWIFSNYYYTSDDFQAAYMPSNKRELNFRSGRYYAYGQYHLTVYYTKTTDS